MKKELETLIQDMQSGYRDGIWQRKICRINNKKWKNDKWWKEEKKETYKYFRILETDAIKLLYIDLRPGQTCLSKDGGSCIFHWRGRAWLTIWDRIKIPRYSHKLMHRKRVTCELHDSYFRSMMIKTCHSKDGGSYIFRWPFMGIDWVGVELFITQYIGNSISLGIRRVGEMML